MALSLGVPLQDNWHGTSLSTRTNSWQGTYASKSQRPRKARRTSRPVKARAKPFTARDRKAAGIYGAMFKSMARWTGTMKRDAETGEIRSGAPRRVALGSGRHCYSRR